MAATTTITVPALGSTRRLRGLIHAGHSAAHIAAELHWDRRRVSELVRRDIPTITADRAAAVAALADRWANRPGPDVDARRFARAASWQPLSWWDDVDTDPDEIPRTAAAADLELDDFAIDLVCSWQAIDPELLSPLEHREAVRRLAARPLPTQTVAERLAVSRRTVERVRAELRAEASAPADSVAMAVAA
jgi:hypothetical protein